MTRNGNNYLKRYSSTKYKEHTNLTNLFYFIVLPLLHIKI
jgi:hypothetical protein